MYIHYVDVIRSENVGCMYRDCIPPSYQIDQDMHLMYHCHTLRPTCSCIHVHVPIVTISLLLCYTILYLCMCALHAHVVYVHVYTCTYLCEFVLKERGHVHLYMYSRRHNKVSVPFLLPFRFLVVLPFLLPFVTVFNRSVF